MSKSQNSTRRANRSKATSGAKSGRTQKKAASRSSRAATSERALDSPSQRSVHIVVPETGHSGTGYRLFRGFAGWLCDHSRTGIEFETSRRLTSTIAYLEFFDNDRTLRFESVEIQDESPTDTDRWRYTAAFQRRTCIVDRYEFD